MKNKGDIEILKESFNQVAFFSDSTKYEKFLLVIIHLTGSLWIIPLIAMTSDSTRMQGLGLYGLIGCMVAFIASYLLLKFNVQKRTKEKVSMLFNPSFRWWSKKY